MNTNFESDQKSGSDNLKEEILSYLNHPDQLELLYRTNKKAFKREFNQIYEGIKEQSAAKIWNARLNISKESIFWGTGTEQIVVLMVSVVAILIAQIPEIAGIDPERFFLRNMGFVVFPMLTAYFAWKNRVPVKFLLGIAGAFVISACYINLLPGDQQSDTLILASLHLPLFLWSMLGLAFVGGNLKELQKRVDFLQYNGNLLVISAMLFIAGGLLTGITMGLFSLIQIDIEDFYFQYVVISGMAIVPIAGTFLVQTNPNLVNNISPVIARIFTPLVLVTLVVYLVAVVATGKNPYHDRDFLLIFNALLIGVLAIIYFSISGSSDNSKSKAGIALLTVLSAVTIILSGIALSAIAFRISEWGITPNRLAVLGANILVLANLILVASKLFVAFKESSKLRHVEQSIASFLPLYILWCMIVVFIFPVLFGFK
ncbi:MAG TPA: hypothetical protein VLH37_00245 [Bacteroidales bacterium]|nr:hypothetical protein [Bacteroidales bacterium]